MNNPSKTLIILSPGFPADEEDSTCLPAQQEFLLALKRKFPETNIIVLAFQYPAKALEYTWNGIKIFSFNGRNRGKIYRRLLWRKIGQRLDELINEENIIGILNFWYGETALVANRFSMKYKLTHFCWILGQDARTGNNYIRKTALKPEQLIALSDFLADEMERNYGIRPAHIIENSVSPEIINQLNRDRDIDILGVGSLIVLKQFEIFIECLSAIKNEFPFIRARICGEGPERLSLLEKIKTSGLENHIFLAGELSHEEVMGWMRRSKILLHPSSYEGFSSVCLEALACGTEVISFTKPMHRNSNGWHNVSSKTEMIQVIRERLMDKNQPAIEVPFVSDDAACKMMELFSEFTANIKYLTGNGLKGKVVPAVVHNLSG